MSITEEIRARYSKPNIISLAKSLQDLYWKGAEREIANVILAFEEIQSVHPEETEEEKRETEEGTGLTLDAEKDKIINEWLKNWSKDVGKNPREVILTVGFRSTGR